MSLKDIISRTNSKLSKSTKKNPFSFGHFSPSFAIEDGSGDPNLWVPSGIRPLDCALGGGLAMGRITELFSDNEGDGKTSLALLFAAQIQKVGGTAVWYESESSLDKIRASSIGVDLSTLIKWTPDTLEDGFRYLGELIKQISADKDQSSKPTIVVWDTIAMARTEGERDGDAFRDGLGAGPRAISQAIKNYAQEMANHNVHLLLVNQSYTDINSNKGSYFGPQFQTPGGKRIKFASSYRIKCKRVGYIGKKRDVGPTDEKLGIKVRITTVKNKLAVPYRNVDLYLYGNTGYNEIMSMAGMFVEDGIYKWPDGIQASPGGRYKLINSSTTCYWHEIEQAVLSNPDTYSAWMDRWEKIFPTHPSRVKDSNGWTFRDKSVSSLSPTPNGILSFNQNDNN